MKYMGYLWVIYIYGLYMGLSENGLPPNLMVEKHFFCHQFSDN